MSVADELLRANEQFVKNFDLGNLAVRPKRHLAVLACMDSRILFERCLGLHPGDAHMIRNAGGIATEDALRSLIVSHHLLDTQEFIIINHTDCGLLKVREDELKKKLAEKMGTPAGAPEHFHAFDDLEVNVREQMRRREDGEVERGRKLIVWRGHSLRQAQGRLCPRMPAAPAVNEKRGPSKTPRQRAPVDQQSACG